MTFNRDSPQETTPEEWAQRVGEFLRTPNRIKEACQCLGHFFSEDEPLFQESDFQHIETALSHLFLIGPLVFKFKKAIDVGYVDFRTPQARRRSALREIELNQRLAPELYLGGLAIRHSSSQELELTSLENTTQASDFLVVMARFPEQSTLEELISRNGPPIESFEGLAETLANFHLAAKLRPEFGSYEWITKLLEQNIERCKKHIQNHSQQQNLEPIQNFILSQTCNLKELIQSRQHSHIVLGHGDLHTGNIFLSGNRLIPFDCLEYCDEFSCLDRWADMSFLVMDLARHERLDLAFAIINHYLLWTNDFEGLKLLRIYAAHYALVRFSVHSLEGRAANENYLKLALQFSSPGYPFIVAVGGLSGSGKTTLARSLGRTLSAVKVSSDAVRKSLAGVPPFKKAPPESYAAQVTKATYQQVTEDLEHIISADLPAVVDATFLDPTHRELIQSVALKNGLPFVGLWCYTDLERTAHRLNRRRYNLSDATSEVLSKQLKNKESEPKDWIRIETSGKKTTTLTRALKEIQRRIGRS